MVVGEDKLTYINDAGRQPASLLETKILINSVISDLTKDAKFMTYDLKYCDLAMPISKPKYMKISLASIPHDIV